MKYLVAALFSVVSIQASAQNFNSQDSWCEQIVNHELDKIEQFFTQHQNDSDNDKVAAINKEDLRLSFFRIEMVARMMNGKGGKYLETKGAEFKEVEDAIGQVDLQYTLLKFASDKDIKAGAATTKINEPALAAHFKSTYDSASATLAALLKERGLWDSAPEKIAKWKQNFADKVEWKTGDKGRLFLSKNLAEFAKNLHDRVKKDEFDNADIEKGLHELRRNLRWIMMEVTALDGVVQFQNDTLSADGSQWLQELKSSTPDFYNNKYLKIQTAQVPSPLLIPYQKAAIISNLVAIIGENKDLSEVQIEVQKALKEMGNSAADIKRVMTKVYAKQKAEAFDHQSFSREIQKRLSDAKILKGFADDLQEWN